jgi:polyribonucleotide nucleotidyltransferase
MNSHFFTLNQAAREVKKSPSTIHKALKNGKLSYVLKDESGYRIDPAELFRVFPANNIKNTKNEQERMIENTKENREETKDSYLELALLKRDLEHERNKTHSLTEQLKKSEEREIKLQSINQELAEGIKRQTLMLEDMRNRPPEKPTETRKGFLARLLG